MFPMLDYLLHYAFHKAYARGIYLSNYSYKYLSIMVQNGFLEDQKALNKTC